MRYLVTCIAWAMIEFFSFSGANSVRAADDPTTIATPTPNPDAIFLRAAKITRALPQPNFAVYDLVATESGLTLERNRNADGSVTSSFYWTKINDKKQYHVLYRVGDALSTMRDIATGQKALGAPIPVPIIPATALSPFDKTVQSGGPKDGPSPAATPSGPASNVAEKVIGEISVEASGQYAVAFAGIGEQGGVPVFHLHLRARTDPSRHPLTDIYVDTATYRIVRAIAAYSASVVIDGYKCTASIDFAPAGPYWIVTDGVIEGSAHVFFQRESGSYTFAIENPTFPAALPNTDFTATAATKGMP